VKSTTPRRISLDKVNEHDPSHFHSPKPNLSAYKGTFNPKSKHLCEKHGKSNAFDPLFLLEKIIENAMVHVKQRQIQDHLDGRTSRVPANCRP